MNILILGCSFGVPENGCPAEMHTENQLRLLGHNVYNCARGGASNLESLAIGKQFLENNSAVDIDWVVWFHTEIGREFVSEKYHSYIYDIEKMAQIIYENYSKFLKSINAKVAIIGGAAPVYPNLFGHINPDFCIPYWFEEILNLQLPETQILSKIELIEKFQCTGPDQKIKILEQHEEILNALYASEDFPDNYHAGGRPHIKLAQRLHDIFTGG